MSQERKTKLSDVARQNNAAKAARFSASMIPAPPPIKTEEPPEEPPEEPLPEPIVAQKQVGMGEEGSPEPTSLPVEVPATQPVEPVNNVTEPVDVPAKSTRPRRSNGLMMEDVISPEPPKGEPYAKQVRISETHHRLLRKLAFHHDKTINHVLYNLLEQLDQADQRNQ